MKLPLTLTALLLAPLALISQPQQPPARTVRDHLWLFACPPPGAMPNIWKTPVTGEGRA